MKYLVFILALIIALPTVQAGHCGMGEAETAVERTAGGGHDCCPDEAGDQEVSESPCADGNHCSGCYTAASAVPVTFLPLAHTRPDTSFEPPVSSLLPSHSAPPFRPPIS